MIGPIVRSGLKERAKLLNLCRDDILKMIEAPDDHTPDMFLVLMARIASVSGYLEGLVAYQEGQERHQAEVDATTP